MSGLAEAKNKNEYFQAVTPGNNTLADGTGQSHIVSFTGAAVDSQAFHRDTTLVELFSSQDCWVLLKESTDATAAAAPAVGAAPTKSAKTYCKFIPGGITAFIGIPRHENKLYVLSVIQSSVAGSLYVTEGA